MKLKNFLIKLKKILSQNHSNHSMDKIKQRIKEFLLLAGSMMTKAKQYLETLTQKFKKWLFWIWMVIQSNDFIITLRRIFYYNIYRNIRQYSSYIYHVIFFYSVYVYYAIVWTPWLVRCLKTFRLVFLLFVVPVWSWYYLLYPIVIPLMTDEWAAFVLFISIFVWEMTSLYFYQIIFILFCFTLVYIYIEIQSDI